MRINRRPSSEMGDAAGQFSAYENDMDVADGQTPFDEVDSVIHELFHAILYSQGRTEDEIMEEHFVRALATGLTGVLFENPRFAQWLGNLHKTHKQ